MCRIHAQRNQTDITVSHLRKPIAQNWSHYTPTPSVCWPPEHIDCVFDNDASPVERFQKITVISQYARIIVQRWDINMPRAELEIRILCLIEHMQCFKVQRTYVGKYLCCIKCAITTLAVKLKIDSNAIQTPIYHPIDNLQS